MHSPSGVALAVRAGRSRLLGRISDTTEVVEVSALRVPAKVSHFSSSRCRKESIAVTRREEPREESTVRS